MDLEELKERIRREREHTPQIVDPTVQVVQGEIVPADADDGGDYDDIYYEAVEEWLEQAIDHIKKAMGLFDHMSSTIGVPSREKKAATAMAQDLDAFLQKVEV